MKEEKEEIENNNADVDVVLTASDTIEETIANRNNACLRKFGAVMPSTIDIDNAKWQKDYSDKMDRNLDRFKELGLYSQLQEMGILYDERQFQRTRAILPGGKSYIEPNPASDESSILDDSYDDVERQFDEQIEHENGGKS